MAVDSGSRVWKRFGSRIRVGSSTRHSDMRSSAVNRSYKWRGLQILDHSGYNSTNFLTMLVHIFYILIIYILLKIKIEYAFIIHHLVSKYY